MRTRKDKLNELRNETSSPRDPKHPRTKRSRYPRRLRDGRLTVQRCEGCGSNPADPPSHLCVGCQAYREHQQ